MTQLPPSTPRARTTDPDTSHAAALTVSNTAAVRGAILALLDEHGPSTDVALARHYAARWRGRGGDLPLASASGLRTRRAELVTAGMVHDTGDRERLPSGRLAILWAAGFRCPGCSFVHPLADVAEVDLTGDLWCAPCWQVLTGA